MLYVGIMNGLFLLRYGAMGQARLRGQLYLVVLAALFAFSAFRYEVGCDWSGYFWQYVGAGLGGLDRALANREPIWWAILAGLHVLDMPYPWANVISSAIFFGGVHVLARRQPDPLAFLILLFPILIVSIPMSGIRQASATGLLCVALAAFLDRRPLLFAFWILVAAGFHNSVLLFGLMTPLATGRYSRSRIALAVLLAIPGGLALVSGDSAQLAVDRYVVGDVDAAGSAFRVGMLFLTGLYFMLLLRRPWRQSFPGDYPLASIGAAAMLLLALLVPFSTVIGDRLGYYLVPIQALIFARLPVLQLGPSRSLQAALPYLGLILVFTVWSLHSSHFQQCYLPYQSWILGFPGGVPFRL